MIAEDVERESEPRAEVLEKTCWSSPIYKFLSLGEAEVDLNFGYKILF